MIQFLQHRSLLLVFSALTTLLPADQILLDEVGSEKLWSGLELDASKAHEGKAGWKSTGVSRGSLATMKFDAADLSGATGLRFWLWSSAALGCELFVQVTVPGPNTNGDYWLHRMKVDWAGWKQVEIPRDRFQKTRKPDGWNGVQSIGLLTTGWGVNANPEWQAALDRFELIGNVPAPSVAKATPAPASPKAPAKEQNMNAQPTPAAPEIARILLDEEESAEGWTSLEKSESLAKTGKAGWLWKGSGAVTRSFSPKEDLTKYNALRFWMHSEAANGQTIILQVINPGPNGDGDYWTTQMKVDWKGWKQAALPLDAFTPARSPEGMKAVSRIVFNLYWGGNAILPDTRLAFDRVELLEGPRKAAPKTGTRAARSFPREVSNINVDDLMIPAWGGRIAFAGLPWDDMIREASQDPEVGASFADWKKQAANWAAGDIIRRSQKLEDVPKGRLDSRVGACGPNAEVFALAMDDCAVWGALGRQLIPAAMVVRRDGDNAALDFLTRQLGEIASWFPIQRKGWTQYTATSKLAGEHDGPWLAEGFALTSLAFTLDILGERLDARLRRELQTLLQKEVEWIVRAWNEKIPWYVRAKAYRSNQWALPSAALALACLALGDDKNREAYDFAVLNLAKFLAAQGDSGSFAEGYAYAAMTMDFTLPALWAMDRAGDARLGQIPFLKKYATWSHQMTMPGKTTVNHSDCGLTFVPSSPARHIMLATLVSKNPQDLWGMDQIYPIYNMADPFTIIYKADARRLGAERKPLDASAFFANMQLAVWRSDWDLENAMALWAKGGTLNDFHIHNDQGQLVVMNGSEPIVLDAGAVAYGDPEYDAKFACSAGHNVIQTASGLKRMHQMIRAPLEVKNMGDKGGALSIDISEAQPEVKSWVREVSWDASGWVRVHDKASLFDAKKPGDEWFRWHTGAVAPPTIRGEGKKWQVSWGSTATASSGGAAGSNRIVLEADQPIVVEALEWRSALLKKNFVLVVKAAEGGEQLTLRTEISFPRRKSAPPKALLPYAEYLKGRAPGAKGPWMVFQAENMIPPAANMRAVTNKVGAKSAITGWDSPNARLSAQVDVPQDGWYFVGLKYCTSMKALRSIEVDGEVPHADADRIPLAATLPQAQSDGFANNSDDWSFAILGARSDRKGVLLRLSKGKHTLALVNRANPCNVDYVVLIPEGMEEKAGRDVFDRE